MNKKRIVIILILLIIVALTGKYIIQSLTAVDKLHINQPNNPDSIVVNGTFKQMDDNGKIKYVIKSPKLVHYSDQNSSVFQKPDIIIQNKTQNLWHIIADHGTSKQGTQVIKLIKNVKLHQKSKINNNELTITTNSATIFLTKKYITTDQPIKITKPNTEIKAIGAEYYIDKGILNLFSNVSETYEPKK